MVADADRQCCGVGHHFVHPLHDVGGLAMSEPSITLSELEALPKGTRLETIKTLLRIKQNNERLEKEIALKLEFSK